MLNVGLTGFDALSTLTSTTAQKRVVQELKAYLRKPHPHVEVFPVETNIGVWKFILSGPNPDSGSVAAGGRKGPYEGGVWHGYVQFPEDYPAVPPEIRLLTPIYHVNINSSGRVCSCDHVPS